MRARREQLGCFVTTVTLLWLTVLPGCRSAESSKFPPSLAAPGQPTHTVFVTTNHWHAGLVLADNDLPPRLDAALQPWRDELNERGQPSAAYHEFGWGDDAYYKAPAGTKTSGMTLAAMLWPTRSINHVWAWHQTPAFTMNDYDVSLFRIEVSASGYQALCDFLLTRLTEPVVVEDEGVYDPSSAFLTANPKRKYHLLHNCNHMVADALAAAGLPISPVYAVHAVNIEYQLDRIAEDYDEVTRIQARLDDRKPRSD
ncbi:MAG: DUF2459 domain-containing protein [Planctomycetota bacterium]